MNERILGIVHFPYLPKDLRYEIRGECFLTFHALSGRDRRPVMTYNGRRELVSRVIFFMENGYMPEAVMHSCDNPKCINPKHLIAGNRVLNNKDRASKNRSASGEKNGRSKLTKEQVAEIRSDKVHSKSYLSRKYGVDRRVIRLIIENKIWPHTQVIQQDIISN